MVYWVGIENSFDLNFLDSLCIGWIKLSPNSVLFNHCFPIAWHIAWVFCWIDLNWITAVSIWIRKMQYLSQHMNTFEFLSKHLHHLRSPLHCSLENSMMYYTVVQKIFLKQQFLFILFLALFVKTLLEFSFIWSFNKWLLKHSKSFGEIVIQGGCSQMRKPDHKQTITVKWGKCSQAV